MKSTILSILCLVLSAHLFAQAPQALNYQAVARDQQGNPLANQCINLQLMILDSSASGPILYQERHDNVMSNDFGLFTLEIGTQLPIGTSDFDQISWHQGSKWLQMEMDVNCQTNYQLMGTSQLLSVPYALYAERTSQLSRPDYDSDWMPMSSQSGSNSYKEVFHNFGEYPSRVKVLVRAIDGDNNGFIFEGMGAAQNDDDEEFGRYGGVIFAYSQSAVRIWAPDEEADGGSFYPVGRIINVGDGWGGEINNQVSQSAEVKVLAWR